ncbi:MAG: MATE family efflux transporter [Thermoleophilia bacterium]|nr:MATE family efflux transporter [Thermoleophilia bacterium]
MRLRSQYDGEILRLAVPALGALAAEPLYVLVDTGIVGHLGRPQLAALGIAATVLTSLFGVFNFLQYGTTAQVGRASGAGEAQIANRLGAQALWLSLGFGAAIAAGVLALAPWIVELMGGEGDTADYAVTYMRIAALGLPFAFLALGGQGYLRGVADLRTPLVIVIAANVVNAVLEVLFVYGFDWGIEGSAWGTVIAQAGMGVAFVVVILRAGGGDTRPARTLMRRLIVIGRHIFVRTAALLSAFTLAGAVIARFGDASLAAHQVAFQLWIFLAFVLDAIAIAGQVIVGRGLGAGDTERAYAASVRMIWLSVWAGVAFGAVMLALEGALPYAFTSDEAVVERAQAIWPLFALMQPLNGAVFALDGILIGAGDGRYLMWSMVAAFAACAAVSLAALALDAGIVGVWVALVVLICVRLALMLSRFRGRRWLVTGWA